MLLFSISRTSSRTSRRFLLRQSACATATESSSLSSPFVRHYHATQQREILPILAGLSILFIGRYSYRALRRMDDEWHDYEWQLQQYERQHGPVVASEEIRKKYPDGTIGIDVGTFYLKLAKDKTGILVNREGARYTFGGVVRSSADGDSGENDVLVGQRAFEKYWEVDANKITKGLAGQAAQQFIPTVVPPALEDALARANANIEKVRPVVTVPPLKWDEYQAAYSKLFENATLVPEPVAAIWGAQTQQELPQVLDSKTTVLVIDVGALETSLSVVQSNIILSTTTIDTIGADLYVQAIVDYVVSQKPSLQNDSMALQRVYMAAHAAVAELNTQTHAQVHIPYIGMNLETRAPEHLDERIARTVVEQKVTHAILTTTDDSKLSTHMPPPTNLSFLWMSILTKLLEATSMTPIQLSHVLLVGGGIKHKMMQTSIRECFVTMQGNADTLVIPREPTEVVALGGASVLQNYSYDSNTGLVRDELDV